MRKSLFILVLMTSFPSVAAEEMSAGQLYSFCTAKDETARTACRFYILGAVQGMGLLDGAQIGTDGRFSEKQKTVLCVPEGTSDSKMVAAFETKMRQLKQQFPDDLKLPAISLVGATLMRAYPCPK